MTDRHNRCPNPACGNDVTGWRDESGNPPTRVTGLLAAGFGRDTGARFTVTTTAFTPAGAVVGGQPYTLSCYARPTGITSGTVFIEWTLAGGGHSYVDNAPYSLSAGVVGRISVAGTAPADAVTAGIVLSGANYVTNPTSVSQVLIEQAAALDSYFDGDTADAVWDGTPGSSTSTLHIVSGVILPELSGRLSPAGRLSGRLSPAGRLSGSLQPTGRISGRIT